MDKIGVKIDTMSFFSVLSKGKINYLSATIKQPSVRQCFTASQTYNSWAEPLFQQEQRRALPPDLEKKLISFNLTAANVLFSYIHTFGLKDKLLSSDYGLQYFQPIRFYLKNHHTTGMAYNDEIIRLG